MTPAEQLAAVTRGWRDTSPRAQRKRDAARTAARRRRALARQQRERDDFTADLELLLGTDTIANISTRLGVRPDTIVQRCRRWGRPDLAAKVEAGLRLERVAA